MKSTVSNRINADRRGVLSSLWIFVLFNMLFRDIHEFARPGAIEEFMAMEVAEGLLLAAGIVLSLFISMIVLNRVLPSGAARWANVTVSVVAIASDGGQSTGRPRRYLVLRRRDPRPAGDHQSCLDLADRPG